MKDLSHRHNQRLAKKLLVGILLVSTAITTILTAVSFYFDYLRQMEHHSSKMEEISNDILPTLSTALWTVDIDLIKVELASLQRDPDLISIKLVDSEGVDIVSSVEESRAHYRFQEAYKFDVYSLENSHLLLGKLTVVVSKENLFRDLGIRAIAFFCTQGLKTLMVSFLILLLFRLMVTRHIESLSTYLKKRNETLGKGFNKFILDRKSSEYDELSVLVEAVNEMGEFVEVHCSKNEDELAKIRDELQQRNDAAIELERLSSLGEMVAGIAHEIKNPLHLLSANVHMLKKVLIQDDLNNEKIDRRLESFEKTLWRVDAIIKSLLAYARQGKTDPYEKINIEDFFDTAMGICGDIARSKGIKITIKKECFDEGNSFIVGQAIGLSQVLVNLIKNAMDVVEDLPEKWIQLTLTEEDQRFIVSVRDSGSGIPQDVAHRMFDSFFTTKAVGKGTGLGLGICKRIISQHGGSIWVDHDDSHTKIIFSILKREAPDNFDEENGQKLSENMAS